MVSPRKKRKLDSQAAPPQLSAFAARRALDVEKKNKSDSREEILGCNTQLEDSASSITAEAVLNDVRITRGSHAISSTTPTSNPEIEVEDSEIASESLESDGSNNHSSSPSRAESPEVLLETTSIPLSSFKPSKTNTRELEDGTISLKLAPGERLIILGEYEISIDQGTITLMGAILRPSKLKYMVCSPSSHSLPVIRCLGSDFNHAKIRLHQYDGGLRRLSSLSPLFGKMWNDGLGPLGIEYKSLIRKTKKSTYRILLSSSDGPPKAFLQPIISAPEWNRLLAKFSDGTSQRAPTILICGPKSSGKSTFAKILTNKLLSDAQERSSTDIQGSQGVMLLDIDPGQPEYSVPGQLSLVHIREPNFGPPFSHPLAGLEDHSAQLVRAHTVASITPAQDPDLYMRCTLDLVSAFRQLSSQNPKCPLVINTPGWILGTGLEILVKLITDVRPSDVVYMSLEGPRDVVSTLLIAAKNTSFYTLPSQTCEYTTRKAVHLRTMQVMSYFHRNAPSKEELAWNSSPLISMAPWKIKYAGEGAGILGILPYGEQPSADNLLDSINGSIVAIVVIEDLDAIPGLRDEMREDNHGNQPERSEQSDMEDTDYPASPIHHPLIIRTPNSDLPYFNPLNTFSLSPEHSQCIGLALLRGIDITHRRLQVLTPIRTCTLENINTLKKRIVLVSGKFDTPGWAYTEDMVLRATLQKEGGKTADGGNSSEEKVNSEEIAFAGDFRDVPWVEKLDNSQGRGVGSRVWRVRRDLGRSDGGD